MAGDDLLVKSFVTIVLIGNYDECEALLYSLNMRINYCVAKALSFNNRLSSRTFA